MLFASSFPWLTYDQDVIYLILFIKENIVMTLDTEMFIWEVESRKAIWDATSVEYSDCDLKKRRWDEITNIMCEESLTEKE